MDVQSQNIDEYSFLPQITVKVKTGLVAFMDILGYSCIKTENLERVAGHIFAAMNGALTQKDIFMEGLDYTNYMSDEDLVGYAMPKDEQRAIDAIIGLINDRISVSMISDSFICYADLSDGLLEQDKSFVVSAFINIVSSVYCSLFTNGLPLRGGITYGRYVANDWRSDNGTAFLGEAVMRAHHIEISINTGCIALDKSAFDVVSRYYTGSEKSRSFQDKYNTRLCLSELEVKKHGACTMVCIDRDNAIKSVWWGEFRGMVESSFSAHGKSSSIDRSRDKVESTIHFFEKSKPYSFGDETSTPLWFVHKRIVHFCAGLEYWNGMANTARQFVKEELARGVDSVLTNNPADVEYGVDVVMIHGAWLPALWKVAKRAKAVGAKLYIRPAGSYDPVRRAYHGWKKKLGAFFEHRMIRRADVLLATCEAEAGWIREYEPMARKIEITNLKRFFNLPKNDKTGQIHFVISNPLHLLYLGRKHPLKGIEFLEQAVVGLPDVELRIVSDAKGEELDRIWQWCEVLVLPTLSENFGRVVAEALERGKRVITTDGAPAWGDGDDYGGLVVYLKGYRDGTDEDRIQLLNKAIKSFCEGH